MRAICKKQEKTMEYEFQKPPDGGWGWVIVVGTIFVLTQLSSILRCYAAFYSPLIIEYNSGFTQVSILTALAQIGYGIASFCAPVLLSKFNYRQCLIGAGFISSIAVLSSSFAKYLWHVHLFAGVIPGACVGIAVNGSLTMVARYFFKRRNAATQLCFGGAAIGVLLTSPTYQLLIDAYAWRGALQVIAGFFLNIMVVGSVMRPIVLADDVSKEVSNNSNMTKRHNTANRKADSNNNNKQASIEIVDQMGTSLLDVVSQVSLEIGNSKTKSENLEKGVSNGVKKALKRIGLDVFMEPTFYAYILSWSTYAVSYYSIPTYLFSYGRKTVGLTEIEASTLVSAIMCGEFITRILYGILLDKLLPQHRLLLCAAVKILMGGVFCTIPFLRSYLSLLIGSAFLGIAGGGMDGIYTVLASELFGINKLSAVIGYGNVVIYGILSISTIALGACVDATNNIATVFYIGCASAVISSFLILLLNKLMSHNHSKFKEGHDKKENLASANF